LKRYAPARARTAVSRLLFAVARSRAGGIAAGWGFAHMAGCLPINRLYETASVVAFYHPKPSYRVHILIVPKRSIADICAVTGSEMRIIADVVAAAQTIVKQLGLDADGYRLLTNGGKYQDIRQLHFHLISE
jgi:histidine triad (HIT) family protein